VVAKGMSSETRIYELVEPWPPAQPGAPLPPHGSGVTGAPNATLPPAAGQDPSCAGHEPSQ
jgi:hypothetical protein